MARVLLATLGSYGDLYPYIAAGIGLRHLGHEVLIATSASYREKVESDDEKTKLRWKQGQSA